MSEYFTKHAPASFIKCARTWGKQLRASPKQSLFLVSIFGNNFNSRCISQTASPRLYCRCAYQEVSTFCQDPHKTPQDVFVNIHLSLLRQGQILDQAWPGPTHRQKAGLQGSTTWSRIRQATKSPMENKLHGIFLHPSRH